MSKKVTKNQIAAAKELERNALFPGQDVVLELAEGVNVTIHISPVGFKHIRKYGSFIATALASLTNIAGENQQATVAHLVPVIMSHGLGLLEDCVEIQGHDITLEDLPHEFLPDIIYAWVTESFFGERKYKPWLTMVENLVVKYTGEKPELLEKISSFFSQPDTDDETSSTIDNQD